MRKFIRSIFIVVSVALLLLIGLTGSAYYRIRSHLDFHIQPDQHIVVLGSSLGECCINDSILVGWRNLCRSGEYYVYCVPVLERVLAVNPQIDTVFITAGIPSFAGFEDCDFYNAGIQDLRSHRGSIAISDSMEREFYFDNSNFIPYLLVSGLDAFTSPPPSLGKYLFLKRHALQHGDKGGIAQYEQSVVRRGGRHYSYEMLWESHQVQIAGLERIIELCKKHHVQCVIFNTPLYHIERFYEDKGYVEYLSTLDDSLLIADYNSFVFPDTLYYGDVNHLNHLGAEYFCKHIKKHGIKTQYLIDYVRQLRLSE